MAFSRVLLPWLSVVQTLAVGWRWVKACGGVLASAVSRSRPGGAVLMGGKRGGGGEM